MSYGNRKFESLDGQMRGLIPPLYQTMMKLLPMVDADTSAFTDYMAAMKLAKTTDEEIKARDEAMLEGLKTAIQVPLGVMRTADACWDAMVEMAKVGNITTLSDMQVGAKSLETGIYGAHCNVLINLKDVKCEDYKNEVRKEADAILEHTNVKLKEVQAEVNKRM